MPPPTEEATAEQFEGSTGEWRALARRPLLKAVGLGAAVSIGGVAVADEEDEEHEDDAEAEIDPVFGYPTTDASDVPSELEPDHEVELLVAPPSGPGEPPFIYFDPVGLHLAADDVVQFTAVSPDHTVTAYHPEIGLPRRVPEAAEPFSSPVIGPGAAWLYRFEHEGVYDVYCGPHHQYGMVMRLVVGDLDEGDLPEYAETVEGVPTREDLASGLNELSEANEDCEWPFVAPAEVLGADALAPANVQDADEVSFETVADELGYEFQPPEAPPAGEAPQNETEGGHGAENASENGEY